jgi:hypothetical protein
MATFGGAGRAEKIAVASVWTRGRCNASGVTALFRHTIKENAVMLRAGILWLLGVPLGIVILLYLFIL